MCIHTDTNKEKGYFFFLLNLTHKGGSIQKAYRVSSKNSPWPKSGLYKFSLWDRLKQEALCNTSWCLGMVSAVRFAGIKEALRAPCQIQSTKVAVPDTIPWEACEQSSGSFSFQHQGIEQTSRSTISKSMPLVWRDFPFIFYFILKRGFICKQVKRQLFK